MTIKRRPLLLATAALAGAARAAEDGDSAISPERRLRFARDHGAHTDARIEWWYATGALTRPGGALLGFQLTFFRSRTGLGDDSGGRFAPRQLLFAHAAVTDLAASRHLHAQRIARWSGSDVGDGATGAARDDTRLRIGAWQLRRDATRYQARLAAPDAGFTLDLALTPTQPVLLQGQAGFSRKGPLPTQASHYYSQPQLAAQGRVQVAGRDEPVVGMAWLDHEWSNELMPADAVGWDWIGINLADGGALTAFQLRQRDGTVLWAGGSHRPRGGEVRAFGPDEVRFTPDRAWVSPATGARYPVRWTLRTPVGEHVVQALLDAQELDSRASSGAVYWEGVSELLDARGGARAGLGYLEMTGRFSPLRLG